MRDAETAAVLDLSSGALVVTGEPGAGKSTLLDLAAAARRVLRVTGSESETNLAFAGLHQLLRPVLGDAQALPDRQRTALLNAVGLGAEGPPDRLIIGVAVLTLLSELARNSPLLIIADDVQWLDHGSREVLSFVARRIGDEPLALLVGARDQAEFPGFRTLELGPLDARAAGALLDRQPRPPSGLRRSRILAQAAGNPLALVELSRAEDTDEDVLPLTERLERVFAADLGELPPATRHALLLAAADVEAADVEALAPAEQAGLVRITGGQVRFRHPLVRSAIYHAAPLDARHRAHQELADLLSSEPDRRAWHLAAAISGTDEDVARALEETASRARQRGGYMAAATALERSAELSPASHDRARRLVLAAGDAVFTGHAHWVEQLATTASTLTDDQSVLATASLRLGQVLTLTSRHSKALTLLLSAADDPAVEQQALASAAVVAFYSGDEQHRRQVRDRVEADPWILAVTDPLEHRAELAAVIPTLVKHAGTDPKLLTSLGAMAWLLDETALAVQIFDDALHRWRATGQLPTGLGCSAGWSYLDHGRWAQARLSATSAAAVAADANLPHLNAATLALEAAATALPGDAEAARVLAEQALSTVDPLHSKAVGIRARWALGMAAVVDGDHVTAYEQFRLHFTADGDPIHYYCSYAALAELTAAAVRTGHESEAAEIVERAAKRLAGNTSARMHALIHRSRALLAHEDAEQHFQEALTDPAGDQWPFERAQVLLDYAEWLRRRRRIAEARPKLTAAMEVFRRLGARPWIERTQGELRAAGVEAEPAAPDALTELTPQQQQIIRLAARGLTNREIGERLFLSPRTVGSHLYRSFPKLGITARSQLRDFAE